MRLLAPALLLAALLPAPASAQTIYPLDRAEILAGSRFDFKVEFPGAPVREAVTVTIDGRDPAEVLGGRAEFIQREDGADRSAYWVRGASLSALGAHRVEAKAGQGAAGVGWEVFGTPERRARNVILFVGDGMSIAHRTAARILSKGIVQGRYGGELAMDTLPHMALVSTAGTDAIVTDSANAMTAFTTGHKSCVNALGVYCAANANTLDHPKVETLAELVKRVVPGGMAVGVVTDTEIEDATPAGMVAHTRRRSDYDDIVRMFRAVGPEVIMGGGSPNFLPKSAPGSKRKDEEDYFAAFEADGYALATTASEMRAAAAGGATRLLGLYNTGNLDGALDRRVLGKGTVAKFPDQPDLTDQVRAALTVLSRHPGGYVLMVEAGRIDKYSHSLDWERAVYDTIMLDEAVKLAKESTGEDTLIVVVPDHGHAVSIVGTYDDARGEPKLRERLGTYAASGFPAYPAPDAGGYPRRVDVSRRLAVVFGAYPDHCDTGHPHLEGENVPAVKGPDGKAFVANEANCAAPLAARREGNLPTAAQVGVHTADDVILTASGPGAELFRGRIDNTRVFRVIATALGLGR